MRNRFSGDHPRIRAAEWEKFSELFNNSDGE